MFLPNDVQGTKKWARIKEIQCVSGNLQEEYHSSGDRSTVGSGKPGGQARAVKGCFAVLR